MVGILWRLALRRPGVVLVACLLLVLPLAPQALKLRFEPSIDLLSREDPVSRAEAARHDAFGADPRLILALFHADGVLQSTSLAALEELHRELGQLPGITRVSSLVNAPALVASPDSPAGAPVWQDPSPLARHRILAQIGTSELQSRLLLASRETLSPLFLELDPGIAEAQTVDRVRRLVAAVQAHHPAGGQVLLVGPAVVETGLAAHVFDDLKRLVPFAVLVILLILLAVIRRPVLILVALVHTGVLVLVILGGMAAMGLTVNLVSVLAPVILVPVGVADLLHLFVRLRSMEPGDQETHIETLSRAFARLEAPMVGTTVTTALGFLGFLIPPVAAIRQFGLTMAAGAVLALLITFTLDAALLALLWRPRRDVAITRSGAASRLETWLLNQRQIVGALRYRSRTAFVVCLFLAGAGLVSLSQLRINDTWIKNFDPDSVVAEDAGRFEAEFAGTNVLAVVMEAAPDRRQEALEAVNSLTTSLMVVPGLRGVLSATFLARSMDPAQGRPWDPWPTPSVEEMARAMGEWESRGLRLPRLESLASRDLDRFQVLVFVLNQSYSALQERVAMIESMAAEKAAGRVSFTLGGNLVANLRMVRLAVVSQGRAVLILLGVMAVLALALTRSPAGGLALILPMALAILLTYPLVVYFRIPYGIATSMFPTLVVGLAVDFAIHLRAALIRNRENDAGPWATDLSIVFRGILLNGALWAAGFAVLLVSALPPNRSLGLLCSAVVALSTALTFFLFPAAALAAGAPGARRLP